MSGRTVALRADASPALGGGHVMRCLTLADALAAQGARCVLLVNEAAPSVVGALAAAAHRTRVVGPGPEATIAALDGADVLIVDHYGWAAAEEAACARHVRALVVLDDLANRPHTACLLLDPTPGRAPTAYQRLLPGAAQALLGPRYALVRPAFAAARAGALARRDGRPARRALIALGLTDVGGVTARAVEAALGCAGLTLDVVVGPAAPSRAALAAAAGPRLRLHVDPPDMAGLMAQADLAVGAAGSSAWERCCLGLPTVLLTLADNQRAVAAALAAAGAARATTQAGLAPALAGLVADGPGRAAMAAAAAALVDGAGAARAADAILARVR